MCFLLLGSVICIPLKKQGLCSDTTVDGRNPAKQLRLVVYPVIYKV